VKPIAKPNCQPKPHHGDDQTDREISVWDLINDVGFILDHVYPHKLKLTLFRSMPGNTPLLRRPNGRLQACEPCRKRKVACDHTHPVCRRCQAGKKATQCEYIVDTRTVTASLPRARSPPTVPPPDDRGPRRHHAAACTLRPRHYVRRRAIRLPPARTALEEPDGRCRVPVTWAS
jgi:hypothetical protein